MKTIFALFLVLCSALPFGTAKAHDQAACPVSPAVHATAPHDDGVDPLTGDWYINADRSIWATAYKNVYAQEDEKFPWIRPARAQLEISGHRLDAASKPLQALIPGNYESRFQAAGMTFPSSGCWEVTGRAADKELKYIVLVQPKRPRPK